MTVLIIIFSILALSCAFPPPFSSQERTDVKNHRNARIIQQYNDNIGLGNYKFSFRSSDGIAREETAELRSKESKNPFLVVQGSYTYIGTDGLTYTVTYIADENGFRPSGLHIPNETRRT